MRERSWGIILIVILLAALLGFGLTSYIISGKKPANAVKQAQATAQTVASSTEQITGDKNQKAQPQETPAEDDDFLSRIFGADKTNPGETEFERWTTIIPRIIVRLMLAALLASMLAFRPRKDVPVLRRNLYVAQTQILLAVVASALMMIVGDSAARAFGIFAAASLVRFRTNIRDPKEITVLLISLSVGLATGVGRWEISVIITLFVLPLLWFLEHRESEQVFRAMQLTVKTHDTDSMQKILMGVFQRHGFNAELRQLDPPNGEDAGCIMYYLNMNVGFSTDHISEEIRSSDPKNVEGIEWEQRKDGAYIYQ